MAGLNPIAKNQPRSYLVESKYRQSYVILNCDSAVRSMDGGTGGRFSVPRINSHAPRLSHYPDAQQSQVRPEASGVIGGNDCLCQDLEP